MANINQPINNQDSQINQQVGSSINNQANNILARPSLHQMKQSVKDALCGSRVFYVSMTVLSLCMQLIYGNDLRDEVLEGELDPFIYLFLVLLSAYYFWTCGKNPGYAPFEADDIELQNTQLREQSSSDNQNYQEIQNSQDRHDNYDLQSNKSQRSSNNQNLIPQNSLALAASIEQQNSDGRKSSSKQFQQDDYDEIDEKQNKQDQNFNRVCTKIGKRHSDIVYSSNQYSQKNHINNSDNQNYHPIVNQEDDSIQHNTKNSSGPRNHSASELSQEYRNELQQETNSFNTSGSNSQRMSSNTNEESENNEQLDAAAQLFYCHICKRHQPFRSKHCDDCGRCICKFDHHCFWIGGCVGELNHRKFWFFLLLQSIVIFWTFMNSLNALDRYISVNNQGEESYSQEYGAFAVLSFVLFILFLFTGVLCAYHTFLILTNQTTWEHVKKNKISYIAKMPKGFYPFNQGVFQNIKLIFFHDNQLRQKLLNNNQNQIINIIFKQIQRLASAHSQRSLVKILEHFQHI
ncbi:DHHC zinc finger protein (macronuclear) [Tetrahymena thermophila SB210]|uniref:Palmitoyltransferase n=1 Tax=Tetrahymena thermophila (strain SB210) TaxID=312017 RepID=I7M1X2_TETTS|nr:DHHC zinc finger protein [Tetrahymena thermophila SB210]EAR97955.2 DHHC zinc finger protein [Tetrahymena thermophila SB210]|eukprot:XP_001018200.2 DHHC zinc finger protein [Tetrahymena thermophila SB210]